MRTVDVWRCDLDVSEAALTLLGAVLTPDERRRAERLRDPLSARRAIAGRGLMRAVLASYLDRDPATLTFRPGLHGKPSLQEGGPLRFSSSTSGDRAVVAVGWRRDVGADVERIDPRRALGPIAGSLFSGEEADELWALPVERRVPRFFELWTRKEALAKAIGSGLTGTALRQPVPSRVDRWAIHDVDAGSGYAAAVCVEGRSRVRVRDYAP